MINLFDDLFIAGDIVELRFIDNLTKTVSNKFFNYSQTSLIEQGIDENNGKCNVYFGVLPRKVHSGKDEDVFALTTLWVDLDAKSFGSKEKCLMALDNFPLYPSTIIDK